MTETQERFLRSVLTLVPLESVIELHLFPPIRRGTLETGVAVIATSLPTAALAVVEMAVEEAVEVAIEPTPDGLKFDVDGVTDESVPATTEASDERLPSEVTSEGFDAVPDDPTAASPVSAPRLRILTASYRHTIKGMERGKWTFDVQVEADAPYEAVELVLRGVRHRSSEPADPELVHSEALAVLSTPTRVAPAA